MTPSVAAGILQAAANEANRIAAANPASRSIYRDLAELWQRQAGYAMEYGPNMHIVEMAEQFMGATP